MKRTYRIAMAARLSGVREDLIRAWERRYGVLRPRRTPGGYRVYDEDEVAVLRRLRELVEQGMAISQAAKHVGALRREVQNAVPPPGSPNGRQIDRWHADIVAAAQRMDQGAVEAVVDGALAALPLLAVYEDILVPVQREIGEAWHAGRLGVAEEHLVTQVVRARLAALLRAVPTGGRGHVVCACFPDEEHDVGLLGAALQFRERGFRVTFLGVRTPVADVARAATALRPSLVALSCVTDPGEREVRRVLAAVRRALPRTVRVIVGGRGAEAHPAACTAVDAELVCDAASWARVLA